MLYAFVVLSGSGLDVFEVVQLALLGLAMLLLNLFEHLHGLALVRFDVPRFELGLAVAWKSRLGLNHLHRPVQPVSFGVEVYLRRGLI